MKKRPVKELTLEDLSKEELIALIRSQCPFVATQANIAQSKYDGLQKNGLALMDKSMEDRKCLIPGDCSPEGNKAWSEARTTFDAGMKLCKRADKVWEDYLNR